MVIREKYPWEKSKISYSEWSKMKFDWTNYYKIEHSIPSYLFSYDNYIKGLENDHIMKSSFGNKSMKEIKDLINWWFERCIGAHTKIKYTRKKL
jgi:hypothetical protein